MVEIPEKNIHLLFIWSLMLKGLNALLEILSGILLFFPNTLTGFVESLVRGELIEDPGDFFANVFQQYLPYLSEHTQLFVAFYLLSHGIIKAFLIVALIRNKLWAYPTAIVIFVLFIVYQIYRFSYTHSMFLVFLTVFDAFIIWLTWHEYRIIQDRKLQ